MQRLVFTTGQRFHFLTILEAAGVNKHGMSLWKCRCDCGNEMIAVGTELKTGHTKSCRCKVAELVSKAKTVHGHASRVHNSVNQTAEYRAWKNMRARCLNARHPKYSDYGGRGIIVCERWNSFETFLSDMGSKPEHGSAQGGHALSIDRIDNDGNYEPNNCRWSTPHEQKTNQRKRRWFKKPL